DERAFPLPPVVPGMLWIDKVDDELYIPLPLRHVTVTARFHHPFDSAGKAVQCLRFQRISDERKRVHVITFPLLSHLSLSFSIVGSIYDLRAAFAYFSPLGSQ